MPYLFCEKHGQEQEADCQQSQVEYRQLGEAVLMVSGKLISGPWQCDRRACHASLKKGSTAYLMTPYPSYYADKLAAYDYGYERRYFRLDQVEARVYGAEPPGGIPDPATVREES